MGPHEWSIPWSRSRLYAAFGALLTVSVNKSSTVTVRARHLNHELGDSTLFASSALTMFSAMVTIGRAVVAFDPALAPDESHLPLDPPPFLLALRLRARIPVWFPTGARAGGEIVEALGLRRVPVVSALLSLTISFAQEDLVAISAATAGMVIVIVDELGYGIVVFGAGPLQWAALRVILSDPPRSSLPWRPERMGLRSFVIARRSHQADGPRPSTGLRPWPSAHRIFFFFFFFFFFFCYSYIASAPSSDSPRYVSLHDEPDSFDRNQGHRTMFNSKLHEGVSGFDSRVLERDPDPDVGRSWDGRSTQMNTPMKVSALASTSDTTPTIPARTYVTTENALRNCSITFDTGRTPRVKGLGTAGRRARTTRPKTRAVSIVIE